MEKLLISVIVPIYNTERFLDCCIQSIVNQTYHNLEIILIDDGSSDKCPEICDTWAKRDERIKVIHTKNGGAGKARNIGIENAIGDCFAFVDSDDFLEPHMYEVLVNLLDKDIDISECEIVMTEGDKAEFSLDEINSVSKVYSAVEAMHLHINNIIFQQTPVNKLYRRCTIENVEFPEGKLIDDEFWTYKTIGKANKLAHSNCKLYAYRQQANSVMHLQYSTKRLQAVDAKSERHEYISKKFPSLEKESCCNLWFTCIYQGQLILRFLEIREQKKAFNYLDNILLKYPSDNKIDIISSKQKIWLKLAKISLRSVCYLRNFLKIGL